MGGQGRPTLDAQRAARKHRLLLAATCWLALTVTRVAADEQLAVRRGDAQLTDVTFVDNQHGWAVGDHGAIWMTADGGEHWFGQESGVDCRLAAVHFLDARHGWAAGGWTQPFTGASRGVLLETSDGGERWTCDPKLMLPELYFVKFFNVRQGWALGATSPLYPSGVFFTEDGGRSWTALPITEGSHWTTGDFVDPSFGALAGARGAQGFLRRRSVERPKFADESLRAWHRVRAGGGKQFWAVGDGAWIQRSDDLGQSWQSPSGALPGEFRDHFDFFAVAARGARCWVAGDPGSKMFVTADGGATWNAHSTGVFTPLRSLAFSDDEHGWAVGDLGVITATHDGGKTWRRQRAGGMRAALLACVADSRCLPLEVIARLSADEGYLSVAHVLNRRDLEGNRDAAEAQSRLHEAMTRAGGSAGDVAWRFPTRDPGLLFSADQVMEGWNRANDGRGLERLEAQIVAKIRQWRPAIVVTTAPRAAAAGPEHGSAERLVQLAVSRAIDHAADPTWHSEQITLAGLTPWKAQKLFAAFPPGEAGTLNFITNNPSSRLGRSYAELAAPARGMFGCEPGPENIRFRLLTSFVGGENGERDFFVGVPLSPGCEARRPFVEAPPANIDALKRSVQARRNLQAIFTRAERPDAPADTRWLGEVGELTRSLDPASGAATLEQLAERYAGKGQWEAAAECRELLADRYPADPLASAALAWLVQYYSSGEAQWRARHAQGVVGERVQTLAGAAPRTKVVAPRRARAGGLDEQDVTGDMRLAVAVEPVTSLGDPDDAGSVARVADAWSVRATEFARRLEQHSSSGYADPRVRFPLAASNRTQGLARQADRYSLMLGRTRQHDAWWRCAEAEQWLANPQAIPPKDLWNARRSPVRPRLDGQLNDAVWRGATPVDLRSERHDDGDWPAVAMIAYDDEFLYLAASCRSATPPPAGVSGHRTRDADLAEHDRVEFLIDQDRDWVTYYRLTVDHRGWTADACWGDRSWNPRWYVAQSRSDDGWTVEVAIPLDELVGERPGPKTVWAIGAQRIAPGVGFQSWTLPASLAGEAEGFGLLIFE
jgi:photosystem II stability/assembly factor-like uncharacterized protein